MTTHEPPSTNRKTWIGSRGRKIVRTSAWSFIAKAAAAANLFLSIPFVLNALGPEQFGAWATLTSLVVFAGFLDFGMGNGAMNLVASAKGRGADKEIGIIVCEAWITLLRVAIAAGMATLLFTFLVPWQRLLGLSPDMAVVSRTSAMIVMLTIAIAIPLNLAMRIQLGLGRGDRAFRWQTVGQLLALSALVLLAHIRAPLPALTAASVSIPLLGSLGNTLSLLFDPSLEISKWKRRPEISTQIRHDGFLFFILQLCAALAFSTDLPLISALLGPTQAGNYAIAQRLFSVTPILLGLIWLPLWPIYRNALAADDLAWALRTYHRSMIISTALAAVIGLSLALIFYPLTKLWLGAAASVSWLLVAGFATWGVIDGAGTATATFLNAAGIMRPQLIIAIVFAALCLPLKAWGISTFGLQAVIWVTVSLGILVNLLPLWLLRRRLLALVSEKTY